jgi:hypothetical protein
VKTLALALAAGVTLTLTSSATNDPTEPSTYCRLAAGGIWPNTLNAWENGMRSLSHMQCMADILHRTASGIEIPIVTTFDEEVCTDNWVYDGSVAWARCATPRTRAAARWFYALSNEPTMLAFPLRAFPTIAAQGWRRFAT